MTAIQVDTHEFQINVDFEALQDAAIQYLKEVYKLEREFDNRVRFFDAILLILSEATTQSQYQEILKELDAEKEGS